MVTLKGTLKEAPFPTKNQTVTGALGVCSA